MVENYLKNDFQKDLLKMNLKHLECIKICGIGNCDKQFDSNTLFFGDQDWENINNDIKGIDKNNYKYFFICLFIIIVIDMGIYKYCKNYYKTFREKTMYPKFGNIGFGFSFGNPQKILSIPEKLNFISINVVYDVMENIVELFILECNKYFKENIPTISTNDFILNILNDRDMQPDGTSLILELFIKILKEKIIT